MADVTVLMAVHNGEQYLRRAIDSVLAQTYRDFEFIVVDDGSTDNSAAIAAETSDDRVRVLRLTPNRGLSAALNAGLADTRTEFVARLDADDEALPTRLARQREFMRANPDVALLGSQAIAIAPGGGETGTVRRSLEPASIAWTSVFDNPFIHPTVMFRTAVVRDELGGYRAEYDPFSQDYDLWCRVMERHAVANLPDRLIRLRVHSSSIMGQLDAPAQDVYGERFTRIISELVTRQARRIFKEGEVSDRELALLPRFILGVRPEDSSAFLDAFERLLTRFCERHTDTATSDFRTTLARQFDALAARVTPPRRSTVARIYLHALTAHPELVRFMPWTRAATSLLLGPGGRHRVGGWLRRWRARHH